MNETTEQLVTEKLKLDHAGKILPDVEIRRFLHIATKAGLDALTNQIHLIPRWDNQARAHRWTVQTGIDGFRLVAARTGEMGGNDEARVEGTVEGGYPEKITFTAYRITKGIRCPFPATARWVEYYPGEKQGFMWRNKPHILLEKCSEALSLRRAFPNELSGLYIKEEMEQGDTAVAPDEVTTAVAPDEVTTAEPRRAEPKTNLTEDQVAERNRLLDCMYENAKAKHGYDEEWVRGWLNHVFPNSKGYAVGLTDEQFDQCFAKLDEDQKVLVRPPAVVYDKEQRDRVNDLLLQSAEESDQTLEDVETILKDAYEGSGGTVEGMTDAQVHQLMTDWGERFVVFARTGEWPQEEAETDGE